MYLPVPTEEDEVTLLDQKTLVDYLRVLRYRRRTIVGTFLCILIFGALVALLAKPTYTRTIRILVEGKGVVGEHDARDPLYQLFTPAFVHEVDTQMEVLKSEVIQAAVCDAADVPRKLVLDPLHPQIQMDVKQIAATDVIEVTFDGPRADYIERLGEALPGVYETYVVGNRKSEITSALDFAHRQLRNEQIQLQQAELQMQKFKIAHSIVDLDTERNNRIIAAITSETKAREAAQAEAAARTTLAALMGTRKSLPQDIQTVTTATNTAEIAAQTQRINELTTERAQRLFYYKPDSPEIAKLDEQINAAKLQLGRTAPMSTTVNRTSNTAITAYDEKIAEAQGSLAVAEANLKQARLDEAQLSSGMDRFTPLEREQAELQRSVAEHSSKVATLTNGVEELDLRNNANHTPVLPLSTPTKALQAGRRLRLLAIFAVVGLLAGCALALFQDSVDDRVHTIRDYQKIARLPVLAYLPTAAKRQELVTGKVCNAALLEGFRMLRSNIRFTAQRASLRFTAAPPAIRTLMVTSTLAGEGKSHVAVNLAASMVYDGRRVLLVDANIRNAALHTMLGLEPRPGFSDVLTGGVQLTEAIQDTNLPGLRFLSAGRPTSMTAELLDSSVMGTVMDALLQHADLVVFDTPACLDSFDAPLLSSLVDGVVYVVKLGHVRQAALREGLDTLWRADARILGTVVNRIDLNLNREDVHFNYRQHAGQETQFTPPTRREIAAYAVELPAEVSPRKRTAVRAASADKREEGGTV